MGTNAVKPHTAVIADDLSLFDEQFSIADLQEAITDEEKAKDSVMTAVRNAVKKAANQETPCFLGGKSTHFLKTRPKVLTI